MTFVVPCALSLAAFQNGKCIGGRSHFTNLRDEDSDIMSYIDTAYWELVFILIG